MNIDRLRNTTEIFKDQKSDSDPNLSMAAAVAGTSQDDRTGAGPGNQGEAAGTGGGAETFAVR